MALCRHLVELLLSSIFSFCSDELGNPVGGRLLAKLADLGRLDDTGYSSRFSDSQLDHTICSGEKALGAHYLSNAIICFAGYVVHIDLAESRLC